MADKNTLRMMSQDVLVIPFSEEDAETLDRFCEKQVEEITQKRFESLVLGFLTRENEEELEEAFENFCKDEDYGDGLSRAAIIPVLSEYIVLKTIENVESNEDSALYSLLLTLISMPKERKKCKPSTYSSKTISSGSLLLFDQYLKQRVALANSPISTKRARILLFLVVA